MLTVEAAHQLHPQGHIIVGVCGIDSHSGGQNSIVC